MYPANFFGLFPAFPRDDTVFVAMSFDPCFDNRWQNVIAPAVERIHVGKARLRPVRVDERIVGDSALTEILAGIASAQAIFADITTIGTLGNRPIRNANVMYELGIAHTTRLPEEVLLFRSDQDPLPFDVANLRVNAYAPDENPVNAREQVVNAICSTLRELDLRKNLAVQKTADTLDFSSLVMLIQCQSGTIEHPKIRTMGEALSAVSTESAIQRLLDIGLLAVDYKPAELKQELMSSHYSTLAAFMPYRRTAFGDAVFREVSSRLTNNWKVDDLKRVDIVWENNGGP